jgi:hypothetical protein
MMVMVVMMMMMMVVVCLLLGEDGVPGHDGGDGGGRLSPGGHPHDVRPGVGGALQRL